MTTKTAPMQKTMQVRQSTDYEKFKIAVGNRSINSLHFNRLKASIEEQYLISPIIVNEDLEVIDGQHRLQCAVDLGLPVYYIVCDGYGLPEIQRYNANTKNWTMDDFMAGYIELGKKEYQFYKAFKDRFGFGHTECLMMLTGHDQGEAVKKFQGGVLRIKKYDEACVIAEKIKSVEPYYAGWKRSSFVRALIRLLKTGTFEIEQFVEKLKFQQHKMYDCSKVEQYLEVIEEIYNFKRRNHEKVNLRLAA